MVDYAYLVSFMILILSFFMMTVSFSQKMRDLEQEQGVLLSIGLTKAQGKKIFFYEAICIALTSLAAGILVGYFATYLSSVTFAIMSELPRLIVMPINQIILITAVILLGTFLAVHIPSQRIHKKQISSVLKGMAK